MELEEREKAERKKKGVKSTPKGGKRKADNTPQKTSGKKKKVA